MAMDARSDRRTLELAGATGASLVTACLLIGLVALAVGRASLRNWLAVLIAINSGRGASLSTLHVVNGVDIAVLLFGALAFAGFWPGPAGPRRVWTAIAIGLPLAGIAVLFATGFMGRSGLMGGGLVLSVIMMAGGRLRVLGLLGIAANVFLLIGDFTTAGPPSPLVTGVVAIGYLLLIGWFVWMAVGLAGGLGVDGRASHT